jgi:hypothetical protein
MPKVVLASGLSRWLQAAPAPGAEFALDVDGATVGQALEQVFAQHPSLRGYVVDEHGTVRHHVAIFVDGQSIRDKAALQVRLAPRAEIYILQALSGG